MGYFKAVVLAAFVSVVCSTGRAADLRIGKIEIDGATHRKISLKGPIVEGDARRLLRLIGDAEEPPIVALDSNGGDFQEGIRLALGIRAKMAQTIVEANASCRSACAIAFLGGAVYGDEDSVFLARSIASTAKLGFHAPFLNMNGNFDQASIEAAYDHAIETIVDFVGVAESVGVAPKVAASLMKPKRNDLLEVNSVDFLGIVQVAVQDVDRPKYLTASMIRNYCANRIGWTRQESSLKPYADALQIIRSVGWDPAKSSFRMQAEEDGAGQLIRTVVPIREEGEGTLYWCVLDHYTGSTSSVSCEGYFSADNLADMLDYAGKSDGDTSLGNPDIPCFLSSTVEPLKGFSRSIEDEAWSMVPPDTPITDINKVLASYVAAEPPLLPE